MKNFKIKIRRKTILSQASINGEGEEMVDAVTSGLIADQVTYLVPLIS